MTKRETVNDLYMIQTVHRFILLQADITYIGLLDLGIYRFEQRFQ